MRHHASSTGLDVLPVSAWTFQVNDLDGRSFYVDLEKKACSCKQFEKLQLPCCHALVAAAKANIHIPTLAGKWYRVKVFGKAYAEFIKPVPDQPDDALPPLVQDAQFKPPEKDNKAGRRMTKRIPSAGEHMVKASSLLL